jgi:ATP synthase protein I
MVRRALVPGTLAVPIAFAVGLGLGDLGSGISAALGVVVVVANFAAHGLSLSWAAAISIPLLHAVALVGVVVRLGVIVALMFALSGLSWFSPTAFGVTVVPATLLLLTYEARVVLGGVGPQLQIPAEPAAARAGARLAARGAG